LTEVERARWDAMRSALGGLARSMRAGDLDTDSQEAAWEQVRQIDLDMSRVRDALHVPDDAGELAAPLEVLLRRIPDGWGRWIDCDAGWYPILVDLDMQLATLDPDYDVQQIKEKFGTLRFYCSANIDDADASARFDELVRAAENASAFTCERCGRPGALCETASRWYKTLCSVCVDAIAAEGGGRYQSVKRTS
jgi:hypothetical protein